MPGERPQSDPGVHVHVQRNGNGKKRNGTGMAIVAIVGAVVTAVGFFATYIFATKPELAAHIHQKTDAVHALESDQRLTDAAIDQLSGDMREVRIQQRVTNRNLNKLLQRSRIVPASRSDIMIEMEDD